MRNNIFLFTHTHTLNGEEDQSFSASVPILDPCIIPKTYTKWFPSLKEIVWGTIYLLDTFLLGLKNQFPYAPLQFNEVHND